MRVPLRVVLRGPGLQLQTPLSAQDASEVKALIGTLLFYRKTWLLVTTTTVIIIPRVGRMRGT